MMQVWYTFVGLLPFEWAGPHGLLFMKHALLGLLIIMPVLGLAGSAVVHHRMAFFSDALGHGAFTGVAIGALAGLVHLQVASLLFALLFAALMVFVQHRSNMGRDTVIGALASFCVAAGIFLATWGGQSISRLSAFLVGDILRVSPQDLLIAALILVLFLLFWARYFNHLLLQGASQSLAVSRGVRPMFLEMLFAGMLAVIVTLTLQWIGLLTVNACLILPAATARLWANNARSHQLLSALIAWSAGIGGLLVSWYAGSVAGASIVMILALFFFGSLIVRPAR